MLRMKKIEIKYNVNFGTFPTKSLVFYIWLRMLTPLNQLAWTKVIEKCELIDLATQEYLPDQTVREAYLGVIHKGHPEEIGIFGNNNRCSGVQVSEASFMDGPP